MSKRRNRSGGSENSGGANSPRRRRGRPKYEATFQDRRLVLAFVLSKAKQSDIAAQIGVSEPILRKHYREELDFGMDNARANMTLVVLKAALNDRSTSAQKRFLRRKAGWTEKTVDPEPPRTIVKYVFEDRPRDWKPSAPTKLTPEHGDGGE